MIVGNLSVFSLHTPTTVFQSSSSSMPSRSKSPTSLQLYSIYVDGKHAV